VREYLAWTKYRAWWATRHLNRLPAEGRLRRRLAESSPPWNVHVGAGLNELFGGLNTDVSPRCRDHVELRGIDRPPADTDFYFVLEARSMRTFARCGVTTCQRPQRRRHEYALETHGMI
jgi:hypothetical protein